MYFQDLTQNKLLVILMKVLILSEIHSADTVRDTQIQVSNCSDNSNKIFKKIIELSTKLC